MLSKALQKIYPFESRFFQQGGWAMHYLDEGAGDPVVMVHGNPTWSFFYRRLVLDLREDHRVIVPDHIGMGLSDKPEIGQHPFTLESRVDDLEALLEHLDADRDITLVVHDWGGMIGMAYASRHPGRIKRLVLLNTAAFHLPKSKPFPWQLILCRTPLGGLLVRGLNAFCRGAAEFCVTRRPLSPEVEHGYMAPYDSWENRAAVLRFVQDIPLRPGDPGYDLVSEVERGLDRFRKTPTLICWGERDFVFDRHFLEEWKRRLPEAKVRSFADCGHYILEDAGDEVLESIRGFIAAHPLNGGDAAAPSGDTVNIAAHLPRMAERQPDRLAVAYPEGYDAQGKARYIELSFRKLDEESNRIARGLDRIGVRRGTRTALMVPPGPEFFALTFALFKVGAVPVLIDPGIGIGNLKKCLAEAEPEAFIGIPKAHLARILLRWARKTVRIRVTIGSPSPWGGWTLDEVRSADASPCLARTGKDETAAILFTSGSTGVPKGAVYTHGIFASQVEMLRETYGIRPGEIDLPTFPLFALFAPALGMSAIIPDMDATRPGSVDPDCIVEPIRRYKITQMFGSPALIDRVGRFLEREKIDLPTLKRVISAGAPVPARTLERFARHLAEGTQIFTPYGATESLPVCSIGSDEVLEETAAASAQGFGICVGRPVPGMRVEIIRICDDPIPEWSDELILPRGETGEIAVSGPVVTREYHNRPRQTALAKIPGADGVFFHRMGDLGYFDEHGRLWFCGRKSQRVRTPDGPLFTIACESVFNAHPKVLRTALVGVDRGRGVEAVLCVELDREADPGPADKIRDELRGLGAKHEHTAGIRTFLFKDAFPVDIRHNAKIFREKLALWAARRLT